MVLKWLCFLFLWMIQRNVFARNICDEYIIIMIEEQNLTDYSLRPIKIYDNDWKRLQIYNNGTKLHSYVEANKDCLLDLNYIEPEFTCPVDPTTTTENSITTTYVSTTEITDMTTATTDVEITTTELTDVPSVNTDVEITTTEATEMTTANTDVKSTTKEATEMTTASTDVEITTTEGTEMTTASTDVEITTTEGTEMTTASTDVEITKTEATEMTTTSTDVESTRTEATEMTTASTDVEITTIEVTDVTTDYTDAEITTTDSTTEQSTTSMNADPYCDGYILIITQINGGAMKPITLNDINWDKLKYPDNAKTKLCKQLETYKHCNLAFDFANIEFSCEQDYTSTTDMTLESVSTETSSLTSDITDSSSKITTETSDVTSLSTDKTTIDSQFTDSSTEKSDITTIDSEVTYTFTEKSKIIDIFTTISDVTSTSTNITETTDSTVTMTKTKDDKCDSEKYILILVQTTTPEGCVLKPKKINDINWNELEYPYNKTLYKQLQNYKDFNLGLDYLENNITCKNESKPTTEVCLPIRNVTITWINKHQNITTDSTKDINDVIQECYYETICNDNNETLVNKTNFVKEDGQMIDFNETLFVTVTNESIFLANTANSHEGIIKFNCTFKKKNECSKNLNGTLPRTTNFDIRLYIESNVVENGTKISINNCSNVQDNCLELKCDIKSQYYGNDRLGLRTILTSGLLGGFLIGSAAITAFILNDHNKKHNYYIPDDPPSAYPPGCQVEMYSL